MKVLAVANSKGGVGKTSVSVHLAVGFARAGKRVLLVDLDQQGHSTTWLMGGVQPHGIADALKAGELEADHTVFPVPGRDGLSIAPASPALAGVDLALAQEVAGETILRDVLRRASSRFGFDVVVLDCPPNVGVTVLSALVASDAVVAPVLPSFLSLAGLRDLEATVERVRARLKARTQVIGYVLFAADQREAITEETRELLQKASGEKLYTAEVRVSTAGKALPASRLTAWDEGADARGADDYAAVLEETTKRMAAPRARGRAA